MKKSKSIFIVSIVSLQVFLFACKTPERETTAAFYNFEIQYIRSGMEGDIQVKVFAEGRNQSECIAQAKYEAVKTLVFKGITGDPSPKPLVPENNAQEKYKPYFSSFFSTGGKYQNYVTTSKDGAIEKTDIYKVGNRLKIGVQLVLQKDKLLLELKRNGIIQ